MRKILCVLFVVLATGYETVVEIDVPGHEPRLNVTSLFRPDAPWYVQLHHTVRMGDNAEATKQYVEDATVTIVDERGTTIHLQHAGTGLYLSADTLHPEEGIVYTLQANAPGFPSIEAVSMAPVSVEITCYTVDPLPFDGIYRGEYQLTFTFVDPPGRNVYWM